MSIKDDLKTLTDQQRLQLVRFANRLRKRQPAAHTLIITRRPGLLEARVLTDFELIVFVDKRRKVRDMQCDYTSKIKPTFHSKPYGSEEDPYPVIHPGLDYVRSARLVSPEEAEAVSYGFERVEEVTQRSYLDFLTKHLMFFVKKDYLSVTTVNAAEMEISRAYYYRLYMSYQLATGYVIYNRDVRPTMTLHHRV